MGYTLLNESEKGIYQVGKVSEVGDDLRRQCCD